MELVKKQIHANQVGKKMVDQFLVDDDFNVPDTKNDVQRVVAGEGTVKIEDVRPVENYVRVTGRRRICCSKYKGRFYCNNDSFEKIEYQSND